MHGPPIRTDIVEVYVFRRSALTNGARATTAPSSAIEFLQLRRSREPMPGTWQPVMGHVEAGETAAQAALRELREETGLTSGRGVVAVWQLELVNTFFLASINAVMCSPGFAVEVTPDATVTIDAAHDAHRWVMRSHADRSFFWPGQRAAIRHIVEDIAPQESPLANLLKLAEQ